MKMSVDIEADEYKGTVSALPARADISAAIEEQLIVEVYSK